MQFSATATETDWAMVVNQMGPALQQLQVCLQRVLNAVEDDSAKNRGTACASLEPEIRNASMIADAMAAAATVGRLSAVAEQTEKREKTLQTLKEMVKTEIADAVKRSAEQEKQKTVEDKNRRGRSWRDVAADDRPQLPRYSWSVDRTVFLTPVNQALRKQHLDKSKFGLSLNEALHQVAGSKAQSE